MTMEGEQNYHFKICLFGIGIILSWLFLSNSRYRKNSENEAEVIFVVWAELPFADLSSSPKIFGALAFAAVKVTLWPAVVKIKQEPHEEHLVWQHRCHSSIATDSGNKATRDFYFCTCSWTSTSS